MNNDVKGGWTPGPWLVEEFVTGSIFIDAEHTHEIARVGLPVANGLSELTCKSNARLIAAAPIMAEYLTKLAEDGDDKAREIIKNIIT